MLISAWQLDGEVETSSRASVAAYSMMDDVESRHGKLAAGALK